MLKKSLSGRLETEEEWHARRWPLTANEMGRVFMGNMLAQGWTPKRFWRVLEQYRITDIILALNPKAAMGDLLNQGRGPSSHGDPLQSGNYFEPVGFDIG